eukprot:2020899-Amphidinium_carterae.2
MASDVARCAKGWFGTEGSAMLLRQRVCARARARVRARVRYTLLLRSTTVLQIKQIVEKGQADVRRSRMAAVPALDA